MFQRISKGLLFLTVMILFCGCGGSDKKEEESEYSLYYINKEGTKIVTEAYEPETSTTEEMVAEFIKALKKDPEEVGIKKALPEEVIVVSQRMEEKVLYISFDSTYAMMDRVEEILCRAALVKTFTQIPEECSMSTEAIADTQDQLLVFTQAAAQKVAKLIEEEGKPNLMLRLYIQGGGCSGFQYGFTFDENLTEGDAEIVTDGVKLLVDPMSLQYLMGAEVDYTEGLQGAQFVVRNPNANTTCGCGSSFSI